MNVGVVRPFNAYGPRDDFFRATNHVIPGLLTRLLAGENPLTVWGGKQTRSFLSSADFARGLLQACAHDGVTGPLNLGSDRELSIGDLARLMIEMSGLPTEIVFDASKPDGQPRRVCNTRKAKELIGFQATVPLHEGLKQTIAWYKHAKQLRQA